MITEATLLELLFKGLLIFAVGGMATFFMKKAPAAARHLVWVCTLTLALVLLPGSLILPVWKALPSWMSWNSSSLSSATESETGARSSDTRNAAAVGGSPGTGRAEGSSSASTTETHEVSSEKPPPAAPEVVPIIGGKSISSPPEVPSAMNGDQEPKLPSAPHAFSPAAASSRTPWAMFWLAGCILLLLPPLVSSISLRRLERRASRITGGRVFDAVAEVQLELGSRRPIRILFDSPVIMPMVWGIWRQRLVLPSSSVAWTAVQLRTVLLHELSHLRRHDPLSLLIGHLALALHWPNPMAWLALRGLRSESEGAADDVVLRHGVRPSDFAREMLALTGNLDSPAFGSAALSMANRHGVMDRISAILEVGRNRRQLAGRVCLLTGLCSVAFGLPLAMLTAATGDEFASRSHEATFEELAVAYDKLIEQPNSAEQKKALEVARDRLAQSDPNRAIELAAAHHSYSTTQLIQQSFAELGKDENVNPESLVERINSLVIVDRREAAARSMVLGFAVRDPGAALALLPRIKIRSESRQRVTGWVLEEMIVRDVEAAAEFIASRSPDSLQDHALRSVAEYWGARDLVAALAWSRSLKELQQRSITRNAAILASARREPEEVIVKLQAITEPARKRNVWLSTPMKARGPILDTALKALREVDPAAVEPWMRSLPADGTIPEGWPKKEVTAPPSTIEQALKLPEGSYQRAEIFHQLLPDLARKNPERALMLSLELPIKRRNDVAWTAAGYWIKSDLDGAVAFFDRHPEAFATLNGNSIVDVYRTLAYRDLAGATKVLKLANDPRYKVPSRQMRETALGAMVGHGKPALAMREAGKIGGFSKHIVVDAWLRDSRAELEEWMKDSIENRALGLAAMARQAGTKAPRQAAEFYKELAGLEVDLIPYDEESEISRVLQALLERDAGFAAKWAFELNHPLLAPWATHGVARHKAYEDPAEAAAWLSELPAGPARESAALGFFGALVKERGSGWGLQWSPTSSKQVRKAREETLTALILKLEPAHHAAARIALDALNPEPELKKRLIEAFPEDDR